MTSMFPLVVASIGVMWQLVQGVIEAEYGSWRTPITSEIATEGVINFAPPIMVDPVKRGTVYWNELRPQEGGRGVIVSYTEGDTDVHTWTPPGYHVFSLVHSVGGGAFFVYNKRVYFTNVFDQRLYVQNKRCNYIEPLTPAGKGWRFADGQFFSKKYENGTRINRIAIVREDHGVIQSGERDEAENTIVVINPDNKEQKVLVRGADFYLWPRISPNGKKLAWIQWNRPDMAFDNTELWTAEFNDDMLSLKQDSFKKVASGGSNLQPTWTSLNTLVYVSDMTNWWNLYHVQKDGVHRNILRKNSDLALAPWTLGNYQYAIRNGKLRYIVAIFDGLLYRINAISGRHELINTGYTRNYIVTHGKRSIVYVVAASTDKISAVIRVDVQKKTVHVLREGNDVARQIDKDYISTPEEVQFQTKNKDIVSAFYYPPKNKNYTGPATSSPPLLVRLHGGPTAQAYAVLNPRYQYFTSRGFGVLDVNYRGSTGQGRSYRQKIYKKWGIYDNEDAVYGALHMVKIGRADRNRLTISGESAGGYTSLSCLTFWPNIFKAAASYYGIGDLERLVKQTHKLESRYIDNLIGPYPEYKDLYAERSPINSIDKLKTPTIFFHGTLDPVVPPNQSEKMFSALKEKNVTTSLVLFTGERHGLRLRSNIQKALDAEMYFYSVVYKLDAPDLNVDIAIANGPSDDN